MYGPCDGRPAGLDLEGRRSLPAAAQPEAPLSLPFLLLLIFLLDGVYQFMTRLLPEAAHPLNLLSCRMEIFESKSAKQENFKSRIIVLICFYKKPSLPSGESVCL